MSNSIAQKFKNAFGKNSKTPKNTPEIPSPEIQTGLPRLENYDLSKLKGGESKNARHGGGWDLN